MPAKAVAISTVEAEKLPAAIGEDLFFVTMPMATYRAISDEATKRGLTFPQGLNQALTNWMNTPKGPPKPELLVEQGKE